MGKLIVGGGSRLSGNIRIGGSKNSALPILAATLLTDKKCVINDIPPFTDVKNMVELLSEVGADIKICENGSIESSMPTISRKEAPYELVRRMRASFLVLGPMLARTGSAKIPLPGGCPIGARPVELHIKGLASLGAEIECGHGYVEAHADKLSGANIYLDFPSVGATENIMMAATLADGCTVIQNCAVEPEIVDLASFLNSMGACVRGAGTDSIKITGVPSLSGNEYTVIPDRIEAGTFMIVAAMTGGDISLQNVVNDHLKPVSAKLRECGILVEENETSVRVRAENMRSAIDIKTMPYPGFPTDMQAQLMSMLAVTNGTSVITETVFENRFMHAAELKRMGAEIKIEGHTAIITGVEKLTGAQVRATDLRAGAGLVLAGLCAEGITEISDIHHIERGYYEFDKKLVSLGAKIEKINE